MSILAGRGQSVVDPESAHILLSLEYRVNVVVNEPELSVSRIFAHQVRSSELRITVNQCNGSAEFGRQMKGQSGFASSRGARKVNSIACMKVSECTGCYFSQISSQHKALTGLGQYIVDFGWKSNSCN